MGAFRVYRRLSVGYGRKEKEMIPYCHCTHALQKGFQGTHRPSFSSPLVRCSSDDCISLQKALRWLRVVWSGRNNCVSDVQCAIAHPPHTVQQLVLDISPTPCTFSTQLFLKNCISQSGTKEWALAGGDGRCGAQGEAGLGARGRMGPGAWTVPAQQACVLLGLGTSVTAYTLTRPSLMPVWCVCVHSSYPQ